MDSFPSWLLLCLGLMILIALLRCLEMAADDLGEARLRNRAEEGSKRAKRLLKILDDTVKVYNSMRFLIIAAELALATFVVRVVAPKWDWQLLSIILLGAVLLVFGVYLPRRIAAKYPEKILFSLSWLLFLGYYIAIPFVTVLSFVADIFARLCGVNPKEQTDDVTEEEIRLMVDAGSESGAIDPEEKEMIHNIFELDETPAESVMTHRTDVNFLWMEDLHEWEQIIDETNHSIYPVCGEKVDDIVGILHSRDYLKLLRKSEEITEASVKAILRQPYFVPESIKAKDLFKKMQKNKSHFAVVLDEYGGLGGIISMSDLLEEIVGNLDSEYDDEEEEEIVKLDENTWKILGSADIDIVSETFGLELPVEEYNTFAGMILAELGTIPDDGTTIELEAFGLHIKVTRIEEHRIEEAIVCMIEPAQEEKDK